MGYEHTILYNENVKDMFIRKSCKNANRILRVENKCDMEDLPHLLKLLHQYKCLSFAFPLIFQIFFFAITKTNLSFICRSITQKAQGF
jgi:hypothetical protein